MMSIPKGTTPISLTGAEKLMGAFDDDYDGDPSWRGRSMLRATNDSEHGYRIPLDSPDTRFFRVDGDTIIVILHGDQEYSFDGLGWCNETEWRERSRAT